MKDYVAFHVQVPCAALEGKTVCLTLLSFHIRMCCAKNDVDDFRMLACNHRQSINHVLDALARRNQTESQNDLASLHCELVLVVIRINKGHIRNAMRNHNAFFCGYLVNLFKGLLGLSAHDHQAVRTAPQLFEDGPLSRIRLREQCVQGGYHRHTQISKEFQNVTAVSPPKYAKLVLQTDCVNLVHVQEVGCQPVVSQIFVVQFEAYLTGIGVAFRDIVHDDRPTVCLRGLR